MGLPGAASRNEFAAAVRISLKIPMEKQSSGGRRGRSSQQRAGRGNEKPTLGRKILGLFGLGEKSAPEPARPGRSGGGRKSSSTASRSRDERRSGREGREGRSRSGGRRESGRGGGGKRAEVTSGRLYVGNLNYDTTDEGLADHFASAGTVVKAEVVTRGGSGRSKGFAFVEMADVETAKAAAAKLDGVELDGRKLLVSGAKADRRSEEVENQGSGGGRARNSRRERRAPRAEDRSGEGDAEEGGSDSRAESSGRGERGERRERSRTRERGGREGRRERGRDGRERRGRSEYSGPKTLSEQKPRNVPAVESTLLQVAPLPADANEEQVREIFRGLVEPESLEFVPAGEGADKASAKVSMKSVEDAQRAVEVLHGKRFMGEVLSFSEAP